jgi:hypothetical protein
VTLPEQGVTEDETVLLKKKFFFNDANVDRSDPVQLHLLYVQVRTPPPLSYFFVIYLCLFLLIY